MQAIAGQMLVLAFCMLVGFIARKTKLMNDRFDAGLSKVILNICLPCMIVGAVITRDKLPQASTIGSIFANSWAVYALILCFALLLPYLLGLKRGQRGVYSFMLTFGNVGFIGFPVCKAIFGETAILYAAIFNIPFNILVFTVGILMLSAKDLDFKHQLKMCAKHLLSPTLLSCVAALVLALLGVCNAGYVGEAVNTLGGMTTPAALLIVGSNLAKVPFLSMISQLRPFIMSAFRLLVIPLGVWLLFRNFISDPAVLGTLVVTSGMPVATNGTLLCIQYGGDIESMTRGTFISTALSLITIPLLVSIIC